MSLEKVANGLGSIIKIIIYGFILLVIVGMFFAYKMVSDTKEAKATKPAEVAKVSPNIVKTETSVVETSKAVSNVEQTVNKETDKPVVESVVKEPEADSIESKIKVTLTDIQPDGYNQYAKGYKNAVVKVKIDNNSDKEIQGIKGELTIKDAFGDTMGVFNIKTDKAIMPGSSKTFDWVYDISMSRARDQNMVQLKKWTTDFKAEKILVE